MEPLGRSQDRIDLAAASAPTGPGGRSGRWRRAVRFGAFVYLTSTIVVMGSERAYWYWTGINAETILLIGLFYLIPTMAGLWSMALTPARRAHQVALAAAMFAIVVEGVLTPMIYIDGPLPIMAFMFMGWHGLVAFLGFWYLTRKWLVEGRRLVLATASFVLGLGWGVWALASSLADEPREEAIAEGLGAVLEPAGFARYSFAVGATLAVAHWLLGYVWPTQWHPKTRTTRLLWLVAAAYFSVAVLPAVVWAPLKLLGLVGGTWWLLTRSRSTVGACEPTVFQNLAGRVSVSSAALILLMPAGASLAYAAGWELSLSAETLAAIYWSLVAVQIIGGAIAYSWAVFRAIRKRPIQPPVLPIGSSTHRQ